MKRMKPDLGMTLRHRRYVDLVQHVMNYHCILIGSLRLHFLPSWVSFFYLFCESRKFTIG